MPSRSIRGWHGLKPKEPTTQHAGARQQHQRERNKA